jgi:hypothetical protein
MCDLTSFSHSHSQSSSSCQSSNPTTISIHKNIINTHCIDFNFFQLAYNLPITTMSAQPTQQQAYETSGNPVSKEPAEKLQSSLNKGSHDKSEITDQRGPQEQSNSIDGAKPSSLGRGIRGAGAGEEAKGLTKEDVGRHQELDAEQMAAPGEGKIASAVDRKSGASGAEQGMETDLDRKKFEQAPYREDIKQQRERNVDVGGVLGQRGGPAEPTD